MRKANSDFKTAFISEAGAGVVNNDYFGFVELDEFACYVVADGLYEMEDAEGARLAIETIIQKFQEHPSMRKSVLRGYLNAANTRLLEAEKKRISMKASVTVVVTNYEKIRYACAGNTRLHLYRGGEALFMSKDMSLGQMEIQKEAASVDKLQKHKERNNLYTYLGQPPAGFKPFVSEKIKLLESDIITLFTRGVWEHVDNGELQDVFSEASDDPQESVDTVEELLLSRQPDNLENYTVAAIFINQVFNDPNYRRKRKRIIIISVIVAVILIVAIVALLLIQRDRRLKREAMFDAVNNSIAFMQNDNYTKALSEAETAKGLAEKLNDKDMQAETLEYIKLSESIIKADELLNKGDYAGAIAAYQTALDYAMALNRSGKGYIEKKLTQARDHMNFYDYMELGDALAALGQFEAALEQYRQAQNLASTLYFAEGKQQALDAIEKLYGQIAAEQAADKAAAEAAAAAAAEEAAEEEAEKAQEEQEKADETKSAEELIAQGDTYFAQGEYEQAKTYYSMAKERYGKAEDDTGVSTANIKIQLAEKKIAEVNEQRRLAASYVKKGDDANAAKNYADAKRNYNLAKTIYQSLNMTTEVTSVEEKLQAVTAALDKQEAADQAKQDEINRETQAAAELLAKGDAAFEKGDYTSAKTYYQLARDKYVKIGDTSGQAYADVKIQDTEDALAAAAIFSDSVEHPPAAAPTDTNKGTEGEYGY